jgi:hypothetical protein
MKDESKSELAKILRSYDDKLAEAERRDAAIRAAQAAFPERFAALKSQTIRPLLQEFAETLSGFGHDATVREQEESSSATGPVTVAAITLRVIPKPFARAASASAKSFVEITFSANKGDRKVVVSATNTLLSSGASLGKRGEYELDALTADIADIHVVQTLRDVFK